MFILFMLNCLINDIVCGFGLRDVLRWLKVRVMRVLASFRIVGLWFLAMFGIS